MSVRVGGGVFSIFGLLVIANCVMQATVNWFRIYKIPTGKPPNVFAFEGQPKDRVWS